MKLAGKQYADCHVGSPKLNQYLNDFTIVVQEYFQQRVELWLETVGKKIFDIKHYWVQYEFAPGRGQIHAHLLAITNDQRIYNLCYEEAKKDDTPSGLHAVKMSEWMKKQVGLTATVEEGFNDLEVTNDNNPVSRHYTDIPTDPASEKEDIQRLMKFCMCHECSNFCLKSETGEAAKS